MNITEGYMPFLGYNTYYRIVGEPSTHRLLKVIEVHPGQDAFGQEEALEKLAPSASPWSSRTAPSASNTRISQPSSTGAMPTAMPTSRT